MYRILKFDLKMLRRLEGIRKRTPKKSFSPFLYFSQPNLKIKAVFPFFIAIIQKTQWDFLHRSDINIKNTQHRLQIHMFPSEQCEEVIFFFSITHKKTSFSIYCNH